VADAVLALPPGTRFAVAFPLRLSKRVTHDEAVEHLRARGFFVEIAQPVAGTHKYPGAPLKYQRTPWEIRTPAPTLGQHNDEIFGSRLGLSAAQIGELKKKGVI
jgi:crotonobetainyl-CoA:carnitine CoA-transferase CaiB-like acyl-CoA transferase